MTIKHVSVWLVPSVETQASFQKVIDRVTKKHEAQGFLPHVTILSGFARTPAVATSIVSAMNSLTMRKKTPFNGNLDDIFQGTGEAFHFNLGYKFGFENTTLNRLNILIDAIEKELGLRNITLDKPPEPHMSVLYNDKPVSERDAKFVDSQRKSDLSQTIKLNKIMIVEGEGPIKNQKDVASWQIKETIILDAPIDNVSLRSIEEILDQQSY